MKEKLKAMLPDLGIGCAAMMLSVFLNRNLGYSLPHLLCDGFFVAAVVLLGSGGLAFCSAKGGLDMLGYGVSSLFNMFLHAGRKDAREEDYYTYVQRKAENRKPYAHTLMAGLCYLVLAVIFLVIYQMMPVSQ
jgi:hypothetical protein